MPRCIRESEFNSALHVKISGPHTLAECQQICGGVTGLNVPGVQDQASSGCGCSKKQELFEMVEFVNE